MTAAHLIALLGEHDVPSPGASAVPLALVGDVEVARAVAHGLPVAAVRRLTTADPADGGLTPAEIERLVIPRRTLTKRRARRQRLSLEESNRLARFARVLTVALETFGGDASDRAAEPTREAMRRAAAWLRRPHRALDGEVPLELCATEAGARLVEDALGRIAYGVFA